MPGGSRSSWLGAPVKPKAVRARAHRGEIILRHGGPLCSHQGMDTLGVLASVHSTILPIGVLPIHSTILAVLASWRPMGELWYITDLDGGVVEALEPGLSDIALTKLVGVGVGVRDVLLADREHVL